MKKSLAIFFIVIIIMSSGSYAFAGLSGELKEADKALGEGAYDRAFDQYMLEAKDGENYLAMFQVGLFYKNGWGRPVNDIKACGWFEKSAKGEIPFPTHLYAECLENGVHVDPDPGKAAIWYTKAAELGYGLSYCSLAELYMEGKGVPKDPAKAIELCLIPAGSMSLPAQVRLGRFYLEGDESIRDYGAAREWFEVAAQKEDAEAYYYLGLMVNKGILESIPPNREREYFEFSAKRGYVPAYFQTGKLYFNAPVDSKTGWLSESDLAKAYLWLSASVKKSEDKQELVESRKMLEEIDKVMPKTWKPDLDLEIRNHLEVFNK